METPRDPGRAWSNFAGAVGVGLAPSLGARHIGPSGRAKGRLGQLEPSTVVGMVDVADLAAGRVDANETIIPVTLCDGGDGIELALFPGLSIAHIAGFSRFPGRVGAHRIAITGEGMV